MTTKREEMQLGWREQLAHYFAFGFYLNPKTHPLRKQSGIPKALGRADAGMQRDGAEVQLPE